MSVEAERNFADDSGRFKNCRPLLTEAEFRFAYLVDSKFFLITGEALEKLLAMLWDYCFVFLYVD